MRNYASHAPEEASGPGLGTKALALLVLVAAAYLLFKVVVGVVMSIVWIAIVVLGIVAVFWAYSVLNRR